MENLLVSKNREKLKFLLTYPSYDHITFDSRLRELLSLDISSIFSFGKVQLYNVFILGKGSVGLVALVKNRRKFFVLKIRRTDANRINMYDEVVYQSLANSIGIGPFLVNYSENFILMEFVKGLNILDWYGRKNTPIDRILKCTISILEQSFLLDCLKLDHGQLNRADRHIIISKEGNPTILDFETSSTRRRTSNVTSISQGIFLQGPIFTRLKGIINNDRGHSMRCIKNYKMDMSREKFEKILSLLKT
jgi:putative serine/threonine protein kinase